MAQQVTADAFLLGVYKRYYTDKKIRGLFFRNSPVGRTIEINKWEGQTYQFTIPYDRGGSTTGDYTVAVANAASSTKTAEMAVTPGNIFTVFNITQKEYLAARTKRGAYLKSLGLKMFGACESTRKVFAACLYGYGIGDLGYLPNQVAIGAATMTLNSDTIVKLAIGTQFIVIPFAATGTLPTAAAYDATTRTISAIDGNTVTWTGGVVGAVAWAAGSLMYILGGRDAGLAASMPSGLAAWIPFLGTRTGANWATYNGTAFYGVTRNASTNMLAGWYVQKANGVLFMDAIVQGVAYARRGGGVPNIIAINDNDWLTMNGEMNQQTAMMQQINTTGAKNAKNEVARGLSALRFAMSTNWIEYVYDDPYCPLGYSWILDKDVVEFVTYSNAEKVIADGIVGNEPGAASAEENQDEPDTAFKLNIDDYLNIQGNSTSVEGPAAQISIALYGNFAVREPGHCAVVDTGAH
jgi:hypothetical protein